MRMMYHITSTNNNTLVTEAVVPLKSLSNFKRSLDLLLIDFEIEHHLSWSNDFILSKKRNTPEIDAIPVSDPLLHMLQQHQQLLHYLKSIVPNFMSQ